jgi:hypothetical protein
MRFPKDTHPKKSPFAPNHSSLLEDHYQVAELAEEMEDTVGLGPEEMGYRYGTPETAEATETDPLGESSQRPGQVTMEASGESREPRRGKRTTGADPTPAKPGA